MGFKTDTLNSPWAFEMKGDVRVQSETLFTIMQMKAEGNKYVSERLKAGNLEDLLLLIVEILGVHV